MPISYEAPQPFVPELSIGYGQAVQANEDAPRLQRAAEFAATQRQQAEQFNARMALEAAQLRGAGGRGAGGGDGDLQDAISRRDEMAFRGAQFAATQGAAAEQFNAAVQNQRTEMEAKFRLQAELNATELSQQERMRLQRMKNAIGEVASDASLTSQEKADLILQLKTGINPLEQRIAKAKLAQEEQLKAAMIDQRRADAAMQQEQMKYWTSSLSDRFHFEPDPKQLASIAEDIKNNMPGIVPDEVVYSMARQMAMQQGLGQTFFQKSPKEFVPVEGFGGQRAAGRKGAEGELVHPTGTSVKDFQNRLNRITVEVRRDSRLTRPGETPLDPQVPIYPNLQTEEGVQKEIEKRMNNLGLPATYEEFDDQRQQRAVKEYVSPYTRPAPLGVATTAPSTKPGEYNPLAEKPFKTGLENRHEWSPEQQLKMDNLLKAGKEVQENQFVSKEEKDWADEHVRQAIELLGKAGSVELIPKLENEKKLPSGSYKHFMSIIGHLNALGERRNKPVEPTGSSKPFLGNLRGFERRKPGEY